MFYDKFIISIIKQALLLYSNVALRLQCRYTARPLANLFLIRQYKRFFKNSAINKGLMLTVNKFAPNILYFLISQYINYLFNFYYKIHLVYFEL